MDIEIEKSLNKATKFLMKEQTPAGCWHDDFSNGSLSTAMGAIVYMEYGKNNEAKKAINWLLDNQNVNGSWGDLPGRKEHIGCTACAIAALNLWGDDTDNLIRAKKLFYSENYLDISTQLLVYPAYANLIPWQDLKTPPLSLISDPVSFNESEFPIPEPPLFIERLSTALVSLIKAIFVGDSYEKAFIPNTIGNIISYQCKNGSWFEYSHSTTLALLAMKICGYYDKSIEKGLKWFLNIQNSDGGIPIAAKGLPVYDTSLNIMSLFDIGIKEDNYQLNKAKKWILSAQELNGGWGWVPRCTTPDADDTALSILSLSKFDTSSNVKASIERGARWLIKRQFEDGSFATFPEDYNGYVQGGQLPFVSVTARSALALLNAKKLFEAKKAKEFLMKILSQDKVYNGPDWFYGILYPNTLVIEALTGMNVDKRKFKDILKEIVSIQSSDGSWGTTENGGCVEETALAITALISGGIGPSNTLIKKGIAYILKTQNNDGSWNPTALGMFPPINYSNKFWTLNLIIKALTLVLKNIKNKP